MSKAMDLDFSDLPKTEPAAKPDRATARRIAAAAGSAEGFTGRTAPKPAPVVMSRRTNHIQMNLKVPEEFRQEFQAAFLEVSAQDRSIRSAGEFLMKIFEDWKQGR